MGKIKVFLFKGRFNSFLDILVDNSILSVFPHTAPFVSGFSIDLPSRFSLLLRLSSQFIRKARKTLFPVQTENDSAQASLSFEVLHGR